MITTVEEAQHELQVSIEETQADMGEDAPDEGSMASDLFVGLAWNWPVDVAAEVARREFGFVPYGAADDVYVAFRRLTGRDAAGEW